MKRKIAITILSLFALLIVSLFGLLTYYNWKLAAVMIGSTIVVWGFAFLLGWAAYTLGHTSEEKKRSQYKQ